MSCNCVQTLGKRESENHCDLVHNVCPVAEFYRVSVIKSADQPGCLPAPRSYR